jgi:hypothetical protein
MSTESNTSSIESESRRVRRLDSLPAASDAAFATALFEAMLLIKHEIMLILKRPALTRSGKIAIYLLHGGNHEEKKRREVISREFLAGDIYAECSFK